MSGIGFISFSLLLILVTAANPRIGFSIGTGTKTEDIVKDGITQPPYNSLANPFAVPIGSFQLTWYTHINKTTVGTNPTTQAYNMSWEISEPVYVLTGTGINDTITSGYPDRTDFIFNCTVFGSAISVITISVPPYDDIVINVQHLCQRSNTFNMGTVKFDVTSTAAILDGEIHESFFYEAGEKVEFTQFYAWLSNDHQPPQQYSVTLDYPALSGLGTDVISMVGWVAFDQFDTSQEASSFQIIWTCPKTVGVTHIDITVKVFTGWHHTTDFAFTKLCNTPSIPNPGFMMGFEKNGTEVAYGSVVAPQFAQATPWSYVAGDITQTLWMWLDPRLSPALELGYTVQYSQVDGFQLNGNFAGTVKAPTEGPEHDTTLTLNLQCLKETNASYSVIISFSDPQYSPVQLYFSKPCVDPMIDVGQYQVSESGTILVPDLVHKNIASPNITVVEEDAEHSAFYIWIPKSYSALTPYQQFQIVPQSFHFNMDFMDATLKVQKGDKARTSTSPSGTPFLLITYRCVSPPDVSESVLNVSINTGWQEPVTFSWVKRCNANQGRGGGGDGSSSAWTPFGIFAFTVFILILVWCLVGCGYNYVAKDQRGADAIPGINLYRSIYYKCFPSPKYTPQTDYNYSERETPDYGGTSYQSENL